MINLDILQKNRLAFPLVPDESHTSSRVDVFFNIYKSVFVFIRMECKLYVTNKVNLRGLNSKLLFKAKSKTEQINL